MASKSLIMKNLFYLLLLQFFILSPLPQNAQWTNLNYPDRVIFTRFTTNGSKILAISKRSEVVLYSLQNNQWSNITPPVSDLKINDFIYYGKYTFNVKDVGVLSSTNDGLNWQWSNTNLPKTATLSIAGKYNRIFVGTFGLGVYLSTNNGNTWNKVNAEHFSSWIWGLDFVDNNLFALTWDGLFLSSDYGVTWKTVNEGLNTTSLKSITYNDNFIFLVTMDKGIYRSTNDIISWTPINNGLNSLEINSITVKGTNIFIGTKEGGLFVSTNNGNSWNLVNNKFKNANFNALIAVDSVLYAGIDGAGFHASTDDGKNWTVMNTGLLQTSTLPIYNVHGTLWAGFQVGLVKSINNGLSWENIRIDNKYLTNILNSFI